MPTVHFLSFQILCYDVPHLPSSKYICLIQVCLFILPSGALNSSPCLSCLVKYEKPKLSQIPKAKFGHRKATENQLKSSSFRVPASGIDIRFFLFLADDLPRKKLPQLYKPPTPEMLAYLDFSVSTTGMLTGVKVE